MDKIASGQIVKLDTDRRIASGWFYVAQKRDGEQVTDHSGDEVSDLQNLEDVAFDFVLHSREGDVMHDGPVTAQLVESMVFTPAKLKAMGAPEGALPGGWWGGFRINDDAAWNRVKSGELAAFSVFGLGEREKIDG